MVDHSFRRKNQKKKSVSFESYTDHCAWRVIVMDTVNALNVGQFGSSLSPYKRNVALEVIDAFVTAIVAVILAVIVGSCKSIEQMQKVRLDDTQIPIIRILPNQL